MEAFLAVLKWPFITILAIACGKEDGVEVNYLVQSDFRKPKVNLVCEKPDLRMPVFEGEKKSD